MPPSTPANPGTPVSEIETPALIVELDLLEENLQTMAGFMSGYPEVSWRAHAKTHKCVELARRQIAAGAIGICVQKTGEAEVFAGAGIEDILVTNQVVDPRKLQRLARLAGRSRIAVCCDDPDNARAIGAAAEAEGTRIGVLIEIETGAKRAGVDGTAALAATIAAIEDNGNLHFRGLQAYNGPAQHKRTMAERQAAITYTADRVRAALRFLESQGVACETVTGGGTGTFPLEAASGVYTEVQPGSFIFMDADYARNGETGGTVFAAFRQSLFVLTSVTSLRPGQYALVDAGHKAAAVDSGMPVLHGQNGVTFTRAADDYGVIEFEQGSGNLSLGRQLRLIPGHCDPTVNLHDWILGVRDGVVECCWKVDARGALL